MRLTPCLVALALAAPAAAQIPETFTNLQILPKDIPRRELIGMMRGFTAALDVRCTHCHVGPDNLQGMDFAKDDKYPKRAARVMLQMVHAVNAQHLPQLPASEGKRAEVKCVTCHRGQVRPARPLDEVLADVATEKGAAAAVARYSDLRKDELGTGLYDFRERTLFQTAGRLRDAGKMDDAIAFLQAGRDFFPNSATFHAMLAQYCLQKVDLACANEAFNKAIALDPANEAAKRGLEQVKAKAQEKK